MDQKSWGISGRGIRKKKPSSRLRSKVGLVEKNNKYHGKMVLKLKFKPLNKMNSRKDTAKVKPVRQKTELLNFHNIS